MEATNFEKNFLSDKETNSDSIDLSDDSGILVSNKRNDLPFLLSFPNKKKYINHMESIIKEELQTILEENVKYPLLPFDLEFEYTEDNTCFITVKNTNYKMFEKISVDIYKDDKLIIERAKIRFKKEDSVILFCDKIRKHFKDGTYHIQLIESIKNYQRILFGLRKISKKYNLMNENIFQMILGQNPDLNINIRTEMNENILLIPKLKEEMIKLNISQENAIRNALKYHLSIVIGPPGSGKTFLLINLVYNLLQRKGSTEKILICAPTNKAIDNIIILLKKYVFEKYVRVLSPAKELSEDLDTTNSVHKLALEKINRKKRKRMHFKRFRI